MDSSDIKASVYLIRHGRTPIDMDGRSDGWLDMPLSDKGRLGLMEAQQLLKTTPLAAIYAPDLLRTQETAHIVKSGTLTDPPVVKDDEIKTWNLGVLAGTKKEQGRPKVKRLLADPDTKPLGGESYNEFKERFLPRFQEICDEAVESGEPVLVVCSGSNLRCLGAELFGDPECLDLDEGGLAAIHHVGGQWSEEIILGDEDSSQYES